ncbi:small RNA-binding protein 11, chloroplastic isoform X2 [Canna indica]|uniref:Small RNA-binding protein 11, chloroplastic isoform X2 n=1 Tax=Canna indica TaxID=4628 RepID=A0AAQ3QLN6_9LILI|nr:small RNA-binding protein 11, chloroplastic isoform X2 [Canna indica]
MLAAILSSASRLLSASASSSSNRRELKASPREFPLASRIFVRRIPSLLLLKKPVCDYITDFPYSTGEATLVKLFSKFGQIVEVELPRNEETRRSKGYAFIQYSSQEDAVLAIEEMDQKRFGGRTIYAEIAKPLNNGFADYPISLGPPEQPYLVTTEGCASAR